MTLIKQAFRLDNPLRHYDWGSLHGMQHTLGITNPEQRPQAEIWMGAHPMDPSSVLLTDSDKQPLNQMIQVDPTFWLGSGSADSELPYLFKVLSAGTPLSLQVHPSKAQAEAGFAREEADDLALDAPQRNYKDPNHKPELMFALTEFHAMVGFRAPQVIAESFVQLAVAELQPWRERLLSEGEAVLQPLYQWLLTLAPADCRQLVAEVASRADALEPLTAHWISRLSKLYPGDPGILAPVLLNVVELQPGQAIYLDAGVPHAYLQGTGLEIMACSDNVLRGGLTPKHIDVKELLAITQFAPLQVPVENGIPTDQIGETLYPVPFKDFRFSLLNSSEAQITEVTSRGLEILLCTHGEVTVEAGIGEPVILQRGDSCVIPAAVSHYLLSGTGKLARASQGD